MFVIGVDPGISGGVVVLREDGEFADGFRTPIFQEPTRKRLNSREMADRLIRLGCLGWYSHPVIEEVNAMPAQGVSSSFRFGESFGRAYGVLNVVSIHPVVTVRPAVWKKHFGLSRDKRGSLALAEHCWPDAMDMEGEEINWGVLANDGIAEAALIAKWWLETNGEND
jgi:crossover junction endodeoxyribonuclease RuvC